jgi:hypothetical protein
MSKQRRRRRGQGDRKASVDAFWGPVDRPAPAAQPITPTSDPGAVPRSLGDPPLTPGTAAERHLEAVYEEAVRTAAALAAANGLLAAADDVTEDAPS